MNRILKRPMFRRGGSAGTGITSGLDVPRQQYSEAGKVQKALETTRAAETALEEFEKQRGRFAPSALPGFLTQFGLNLLSTPPQGGLLSTAARAAQEPFKTFQSAELQRAQRKADRAEDIFSGALASEYDLEEQRLKNLGESDERKTAEVEAEIIKNAQEQIFSARDILNDPNASAEDKTQAERTIKIQQNILLKEIGTPPEYAAIIGSPELFDAEMDVIVNKYNTEMQQKRKEFLDNNPDKTPEDAIAEFPTINTNDALARQLTIEDLRKRFFFNQGGRVGLKLGSPEPLMESIVEQEKQQGDVQDLSYTELRARLPQEISNDIVQLLSNSKQALLDFANIQTGEDIAQFNQQYDVNLTLPQGA